MPSSRLSTFLLSSAFLGLASPALAQQGACGGFGDSGIWIGGAAASSDLSTADNFQEQMALVLGGTDYVSLFSLSTATDIRIEAAGRGAGDPVIDLLGPDGGIILSDDDSGGNAASRAETTLAPGTYCMSVRSFDGGPMTAFVRIGRQEHDPLTAGLAEVSGDPAGSCDIARPFGAIGGEMTASAAETPYWGFTLEAPTALTITARNETADPVLVLYDATGSELAENDDFDGLNARLDMSSPLAPGAYCVEVSALSDDTAPITLAISPYDPDEALQSLFARGEAAPPLDGSYPVQDMGLMGARLRQDLQATGDTTWYALEVPQAGVLLVEAIGSGNSDPWLVLYDDLGRELGRNDDFGDGFDSLVMARVQAGTYLIGVRQYGSEQGLIRVLAERYVPAK